MKIKNLITEHDPVYLLNGRTQNAINRLLNIKFKENNIELTKEQWSILAVLWIKDNCTQQYLANQTYRDKPSTTRLINHLENEGYLERKNAPKDKRANHIKLTDKGREIEEKVTEIVNTTLESVTADLTEQEINIIKSAYNKVYTNVMKHL